MNTAAPMSRLVRPEAASSATRCSEGESKWSRVGLTLASGWFGVQVSAACGLGIKTMWADEELARARALSLRPNPIYPTRDAAVERHLKLAGLIGLVPPDDVGDAALVQGDDGWTLAFDPAAFAVGAPDMAGLLAASRASVVLAAGEHDHMCAAHHLRALVHDPVILPGLGHNAHVQSPAMLWPLIERLVSL